MAYNVPSLNPLYIRLHPLEILIHLGAAVTLVANLDNPASSSYPQTFLRTVALISACRLLIMYVSRRWALPTENHGSSALALPLVCLGNLAAGSVWGFAPLLPSLMSSIVAPGPPLAPAILIGVTLTTFAASSFRVPQTLLFALPTLGIPLGWFTWYEVMDQMLVWGVLSLAMALVCWTASRVEDASVTQRNAARQNTALMQKLASTRDEALRSQRHVEKINETLKKQMEELKRAEQRILASEKETNVIIEDMQDTYFRTDRQGNFVRISPSIQFLLGYTRDNLIGKPCTEIFASPADYTALMKALSENYWVLQNHEVRLKHEFGHAVWTSWNVHAYKDAGGETVGIEGTVRDVTDKKLAAEALYREKERLHVTLESLSDGVITTDVKGRVEYLNPIAEKMTGWTVEVARGKPLTTVFLLAEEDKEKLLQSLMKQWLVEGKRASLSDPATLVNHLSSRDFAIELTGSPLRDSRGGLSGTVLVFRNVTKLRNLAMQLSHQATHDALTGLINRTEFEVRVEQAIGRAQSDNAHHALCYLDLDQFKVVNDTCGHHAGDELLKQLTSRLRKLLRDSDTFARLGGDEFGVLLIGCPLDKAAEVAEKLRHEVEAFRFLWKDQVFRIGASLGLVPITTAMESLTQLLSAADSACYVAKERGRNQVHVYQPDDAAVAQHHGQMQWLQRIHRALEEHLFELHIQPIVAVKDPKGGGRHGELLLRMINPAQGTQQQLVTPKAFIPAAERYHLMPEIDRWVVENGLRAVHRSLSATQKLDTCAINLSGQSVSDQKFLDFVIEQLKKTGVPPSMICFEITESAVVANLDVAREFIAKLKTLGCRFALDDFGSGLSSFAYLKSLPVDYLKLDGTLVRDVATDKITYAMVNAINEVAHVMGIKTIAEYVETDAIMKALITMSVDYAQGFGIGRPRFFARGMIREREAEQV